MTTTPMLDDAPATTAWPFPATVRAAPATSPAGTGDLLAALKARLPDPSVLDDRPPFFFAAEISNGRLDAYFTRMAPSSLRNYARDAAEGVPFMHSHRTGGLFKGVELPMGRSLTGRYVQGEGAGTARVVADFYALPGLRLGEVSADDLIGGLRSGIVREVSVGFRPGRFVCSIDGLDLLRDPRCGHVPGVEYEVPTRGASRGRVLCVADVEDATLQEVSAVYRGATPGAAVLKATRMAEAGTLKPGAARLLEERYRSINLRLPGARRSWRGSSAPDPAPFVAPASPLIRGSADVPEPEEVELRPPDEAHRDVAAPWRYRLTDALHRG